jgi:hypothetical protein
MADSPLDLIETALPASRHAPSDARALLRNALHTWALDGLGDVSELIVSELVSNVVCHVGTPMTLRVTVTRDRSVLRIEVDDSSAAIPEVDHPTPETLGGRGLWLIDELATRWGFRPAPSGKTVWAEIDAETAMAEMHGGS